MIATDPKKDLDVLVVGGGPAGATTAALLAGKGRRVLVLEKECFPRYHIGESLLPYCYFTLERLGVLEKLAGSGYVKKHSVQFVSTEGKCSKPFYFFQHLDHPAAQTWQVLRSSFDKMLLDHAGQCGAQVLHEMNATRLVLQGEAVVGVEAADANGRTQQFEAPLTIDASGRGSLAINQFNWRLRDPQLSKISIWTYYEGALRDEGYDAGATTIAYLPQKGWFWFVPLPDDMVSVGVVAEGSYLFGESKDPAEILAGQVDLNPWIAEHLAPAKQMGKHWVTGDYSYRAKHCAVDGLVLVGDAFAFLDPVFSSGVFLALRSGEMAADAADAALSAGDVAAERFSEYGLQFCAGIEAMRKLVYAFYDETFSFGSVLRKHPQLRGDLTDILIGNLQKDFAPLFAAIAEFADVPEPLLHGGPLVLAQ